MRRARARSREHGRRTTADASGRKASRDSRRDARPSIRGLSSRLFVRIPILTRLLAAALLVAALPAGCSSSSGSRSDASHALADNAQVAAFVEDVARGARAHWTLDAGASPAAKRAWANAAMVEAIGIELRFGQAYWGCMELSMLQHGSSTHRAVLIAKRRGAAVVSANQFAVEYTHFTRAELGYVIDAVCAGQPL